MSPINKSTKATRFTPNPSNFAIAIKIDLNLTTDLFYHKWGDVQMASSGDYLVLKNGETYTIEESSFESTYSPIPGQPGAYVKTGDVWAIVATEDGQITTKEGLTSFKAGDYIVSNDQLFEDTYAISRKKFDELYVVHKG